MTLSGQQSKKFNGKYHSTCPLTKCPPPTVVPAGIMILRQRRATGRSYQHVTEHTLGVTPMYRASNSHETSLTYQHYSGLCTNWQHRFPEWPSLRCLTYTQTLFLFRFSRITIPSTNYYCILFICILLGILVCCCNTSAGCFHHWQNLTTLT